MSEAKPTHRLASAGLALWASAMAAQVLGSPLRDPVSARAYTITLGVLTFTGFVLAVVGGVLWWRAKRRKS